jgi:hypothetical protein
MHIIKEMSKGHMKWQDDYMNKNQTLGLHKISIEHDEG